MKTTMSMLTMFVLLSFLQPIKAQKLKENIEKSVVEIGTTFTEIPVDRLKLLDQIAFTMIKKRHNDKTGHVVFVDPNNLEISQLAMVWLKTGMLYYGLGDHFDIQSAGITPVNQPIPDLQELGQYGFAVKDVSKKGAQAYRIKYGSGSWEVFAKSLDELQVSEEKTVKIFLQEGLSDDSIKNNIILDFDDSTNIAKEMLYLATRLNNLLKRDQ